MPDNILIVDDSSIDRKMIRHILETNIPMLKVHEMGSGQGIIEKMIQIQAKVCILNVRMPDEDGLEILDEIKACQNTRDIPVIIMGTSDIHNTERALTSGALDYITKPLTEEVMKIALPLKVKNAIALINRSRTIHYLSYHDELTGLYNRRFFEVELDRLDTQRQLPLSLIIGDLNGLKLLNDLYGHHYGDHALRTIGKVLKTVCRQEDIIARWGGDEFILLLPNTSGKVAEEICTRISNQCAAYTNLPIPLSIALGIATKEHAEESTEELILSADKDMYQKKFKLNRDVNIRALKNFMESMDRSSLESKCTDSLHLDSRDCGQLMKLLKSVIHTAKEASS